LIWAALALGNSDQINAIAPVTKGAATLVPLEVWGLAVYAQAGDVLSWSSQSPPADGTSEIRLGRRFALEITTNNGYHPGMTGDGGAADRTLISSRRDHQNPTLSCIILALPLLVSHS
jgi:hypothetical protein